MSIDMPAAPILQSPATPTPGRRIALASFVGTAIEYYDFTVYGTAATLVFPTVFFPGLNPLMAAVASLCTFAAAFFARPLGGAVFGHFGDRLGRKKALIITLMLTGTSTLAVGLVPSAATIGIAAPLILLVLRLIQGFAVGGEWAGAALLSVEYAPAERRGLWGIFTPMGCAFALVLTSLMFLGTDRLFGNDNHAFLTWGWRVPFLFSAVLLVVALLVRLGVDETPVFATHKRAEQVTALPLRSLVTIHPRETILGIGTVVGLFTLNFMVATYLTGYGISHLGHPRPAVLVIAALAGLGGMASITVSGWLSDRYGRRRLILIGYGLAIAWSVLVMHLIDSGSIVAFGAGIVGISVTAGLANGPLSAFLAEMFATPYRYTGVAIALNSAGVVGGAVPPIIAGPLLATHGSWAIGVMMALFVSVSFISAALLHETRGNSLQ